MLRFLRAKAPLEIPRAISGQNASKELEKRNVKVILRLFQEFIKGCCKGVSRLFKGCFKELQCGFKVI